MDYLPAEIKLLLLETTASFSLPTFLALTATSSSFWGIYTYRKRALLHAASLNVLPTSLPQYCNRLLWTLADAPFIFSQISDRMAFMRKHEFLPDPSVQELVNIQFHQKRFELADYVLHYIELLKQDQHEARIQETSKPTFLASAFLAMIFHRLDYIPRRSLYTLERQHRRRREADLYGKTRIWIRIYRESLIREIGREVWARDGRSWFADAKDMKDIFRWLMIFGEDGNATVNLKNNLFVVIGFQTRSKLCPECGSVGCIGGPSGAAWDGKKGEVKGRIEQEAEGGSMEGVENGFKKEMAGEIEQM